MVVVDEARWVELLVSQWWWQQQLLLSLGGLNTLNTLCSLNTQSVTIASITDNLLHFLHLLDGYGSNTIRFYYLHRGETKLLMYGGSSLIFSNYNAGMRSAVGRRDIIILTPHHLVSAEYSPKYPGEENIQISSLYASLVVCVVQDIFDLFSLNSAGERKNWAKYFQENELLQSGTVNRAETAVSQYEGCILSTFSHRNNSRTRVLSSQKPPPRQAHLWLVQRSPAGLWLVESSPVCQALVFMSQLCQGLNCLQIAALSTQFVMKLLTSGAIMSGK